MVWQTLIPVLGTLAGTVSGIALGGLVKSRHDSVGRVHEWQVAVVEIYGDLMSRLSSHYVAMWDLEAARIRGDEAEIATRLDASLQTRDAITKPHTQLVVLVSQLRPVIDLAVEKAYAMDTALDENARTEDRLSDRRKAAKAAVESLQTAMIAEMRSHGAGLPS
ncbi:hypothetical protein [Amycolatopsis sp. NPDC054798]